MPPRPSAMYAIETLTDISEILSLLVACSLPVSDISETGKIQFYGIKDDGRLIATIGLEQYTGVGLLRSLAVVEAYRGQGLAQQLVAHVERLAMQENMRGIYLLTSTAAKFFEKRGYTLISRLVAPPVIQASSQFSYLCPSSAMLLYKALIQGY